MALGQRFRKAPVLHQRPDLHRPQPVLIRRIASRRSIRPEPHRIKQSKVAPPLLNPLKHRHSRREQAELRRIRRVQVIEHHPIEAINVDRLDIFQKASRKRTIRLVVRQGVCQQHRRIPVQNQVAVGATHFAGAPEGAPLLTARRVVTVVKMLAAWTL